MKKLFTSIGFVFGGLLLLTAILFGAALIMAVPLMWLWNWIMVDLFAFKAITYWQSFGVYLLAGLLFNFNSVRLPNEK